MNDWISIQFRISNQGIQLKKFFQKLTLYMETTNDRQHLSTDGKINSKSTKKENLYGYRFKLRIYAYKFSSNMQFCSRLCITYFNRMKGSAVGVALVSSPKLYC